MKFEFREKTKGPENEISKAQEIMSRLLDNLSKSSDQKLKDKLAEIKKALSVVEKERFVDGAEVIKGTQEFLQMVQSNLSDDEILKRFSLHSADSGKGQRQNTEREETELQIVEEIGKLKKLFIFLDQGLIDFTGGLEDYGLLNTVANLINYSLLQLSFIVAEKSDETNKHAMLFNLRSISEKMIDLFPNHHGFKNALMKIDQSFPNINTPKVEDSKGADVHSFVYQTSLINLQKKSDSGLNLTPFYFFDREGKLRKAG